MPLSPSKVIDLEQIESLSLQPQVRRENTPLDLVEDLTKESLTQQHTY